MGCYHLVNVFRHNYGLKSTMLFMGKLTISTGPFSSSQTVGHYQRANHPLDPIKPPLSYGCPMFFRRGSSHKSSHIHRQNRTGISWPLKQVTQETCVKTRQIIPTSRCERNCARSTQITFSQNKCMCIYICAYNIYIYIYIYNIISRCIISI